MVLKRVLPIAMLALLPIFGAARAAETPAVTFSVAEYLALVEKAEARAKANQAAATNREKPVAEVVEERIVVRLEDKEAKLDSFFEVLVQGEPIKAVWLPLAGFGATATLEKEGASGVYSPAPNASLAAYGGSEKGTTFVTTEPGRYRVKAQSRLPLDTSGGRIEIALLKVAAPVASAEIDLPAELEWSSTGAVVVEDKQNGGRRQVRLATQRGSAPMFQARRRFDQGEEKALAHSVLLTLLQLRPEGLRRHDVLLYEVSRGRLSAFEVTLPPGLEVEQVATDEGLVVPIVAGNKLRVERRRQLQGTGYLVLSSTPAATGELPFTLIQPEVEVRARFLAMASSIAAEIGPQPAASFSQIDLTDLPPLLGQALGAVDLAAAWRLGEEKGPLFLRLAPLPAAAIIATSVVKRDTTTLLTVDGTLLHREVFALAPTDQPVSSFEVELPPGAILWSTKVDGQPMRPLQRGGKIVLPILPKPGAVTSVEVVAVLEQAIAPGRSQLAVELARIAAPVLEHSWRLLLPDGPKYRFAAGELQPVPAREVYLAKSSRAGGGFNDGYVAGGVPGGVVGGAAAPQPVMITETIVDRISQLPADQAAESKAGKKDKAGKEADDEQEGQLAAANYSVQVSELQQGLVGGVKPLPITIPEAGKSLVLTGVLPPERVSVTIDVKARK